MNQTTVAVENVGDELLFVPLGGAGEIGMNFSLYGCRGRWLAVDLGIAFGDETTPGIDILAPDPEFAVACRDRLDGLVITHAHEDHIGAVAHLWPQLRCPVYGTPFAAAILTRKLDEVGLTSEVPLHEVASSDKVQIGAFGIEYIRAAHSIPEAHVIAIHTPHGAVVHATDWKLDPDPLIGSETDGAALKRLGDEGVIAMCCDSTNAGVPGHSRSEGALRKSLTEFIGDCEQRVAVACFSSNVARIETIIAAAEANGRNVCLVGRSLWRMVEAARATGHLDEDLRILTEHDVGYLSPDQTVLAVTGSQGEAQAALTRIAFGAHPNVHLDPGDTVIFSSRQIPGNEKSIGWVQNQLSRAGIEVITEDDHFVHVSGHPHQDELTRMYDWIRPGILVPIHGELLHMNDHADHAEDHGIPEVVVGENGSVIRLAPGPAEIVDHVHSGRLAIDGSRLIPIDGEVMRARRRILFGGAAVATVVVDGRGRLMADPQLTAQGLIDDQGDAASHQAALAAIADAIEKLSDRDRKNDDIISETARIAVRRSLRDTMGKRPATQVHVVRL
ncbi:MAG: ribonuclease J [Pseudomonadota bacterium]|nr:ribonuclease J [Pseudomonadota bacterium]